MQVRPHAQALDFVSWYAINSQKTAETLKVKTGKTPGNTTIAIISNLSELRVLLILSGVSRGFDGIELCAVHINLQIYSFIFMNLDYDHPGDGFFMEKGTIAIIFNLLA